MVSGLRFRVHMGFKQGYCTGCGRLSSGDPALGLWILHVCRIVDVQHLAWSEGSRRCCTTDVLNPKMNVRNHSISVVNPRQPRTTVGDRMCAVHAQRF